MLSHSSELGDHAVLHRQIEATNLCRRGVKFSDVNQSSFIEKLEKTNIPNINESQNVDDSVKNLTDVLFNCSKESQEINRTNYQNHSDKSRWVRILENNDDKMLWRSINWKGQYMENEMIDDRPSDSEFKKHFEALLNPEGLEELELEHVYSNVHVPVLDNPIEPIEVDSVIKHQLKSNKGCGPDGLSPGIFKLLPVQWIFHLTCLLNAVFTVSYPGSWLFANLHIIFKKGSKTLCDNYRGISLINAMSKIYDYVLYNRLRQWFIPEREQAGAQEGRGCMEHIVALRMIMDTCVRKNLPLYLVYVDFSKAYDRIPRLSIMKVLKELGCGFVMLRALASLYKVSKSILGLTIITAVIGVRQGSPTSCLIFIMYVNILIPWLGW